MTRVTCSLFFCWALLLRAQTTEPAAAPATSFPAPSSMTTAAAQLAARISSLLPRRATAWFDFQNLTALPAAEWSNFQSLLQEELRKSGVGTAGAQTATTPLDPRVRVTLSEDPHGLLLVAEVSAGDSRQVAMLPWNLAIPAQTKPPVAITQKPLLAQAEPILDVLITDSQMLVLSPHQVASYRAVDGKWVPDAVASLALARPMPRDPRGRLEASSDGFRAYLPAGTCEGTRLSATCTGATATWRSTAVHWVVDRNTLEPASEERVTMPDPCGGGTVEIAGSPNNEHDSVRAIGKSDALALPGPVTALWPAENGHDATLVVHNLQTGEYEASRLGVACNR